MKSSCTIKFRLFEPMMFRGSGEFDPSARGLQARAASLMLPTPSTIAGAIATMLLEKGVSYSGGYTWLEKYLSILGLDVRVRGPFLHAGGDEMFVGDDLLRALLSLVDAKLKCERISHAVFHRVDSCMDVIEGLRVMEVDVEHVKEKLNAKSLDFRERVGVGLAVRKGFGKLAEEGLLYSNLTVDYSCLGVAVDVLVDVSGSLCERLVGNGSVAVKLGGEGKACLVKVSERAEGFNNVKRLLWREATTFSGIIALYVASPILFISGGEIVDNIKNFLEANDLEYIRLYGEVNVTGTGFSLDVKKRKPIYSALKPGSIIFARAKNCNLENLYWNGLGISSQIGYGTIIPIPLIQ